MAKYLQLRRAFSIISSLATKGEFLMKMSKLLSKTAQVFFEKSGEGIACVLVQIALRLMVAAPLLCLVTKEVPYLALLSIPLYLLIVPVARQNMAEAMQEAIGGGALLSTKLISCENYGKKFLLGLKRTLLMLLWALPFIAATGVALYAYAGQIDAFTLIRLLMQLGGGSTMEGIKLVLLIYAATLLPIIIGCAFHSGARHAAALGDKKLLRGHRLGAMLVWLTGLVALIPFLAVVGWACADVVSGLVSALSNFGSGSITLPAMGDKVYIIAAAFVLLFLPRLSFKQLMTAVYVRGLKHDAP